MLYYILRRCLAAVVMLLVISAVTFRIFYASPTDPARLTCGKNCTPQSIAATATSLVSTSRSPCSTADFIKGLVDRAELPRRPGVHQEQPRQGHPLPGALPRLLAAADPARDRHRSSNASPSPSRSPSARSSSGSCVGVGFGIIAALKRGQGRRPGARRRSPRRATRSRRSSSRCCSYNYVSTKWQLFGVPTYVPLTENPSLWSQGLLLPVDRPWPPSTPPRYVRLTRAYMLETMSEDYMRTARAKGVPERTIVRQAHPARRADADRHRRRVSTSAGCSAGAVDHRDRLQLPGARPGRRRMR